jgi:hypothetical protein
LETQVQNSDNPERVNFLEGKDESPEQIVKKLEQVRASFFYALLLKS